MGDRSAVVRNGSPQSRAVSVLGKNWSLVFLLLMVAVFAFTGKNFFNLNNFENILSSAGIYILLACAETFVIITGGIDLSVGYVMGLSAIASAGIIRDLSASQFGVQWSAAPAVAVGIVVALAASLLCGLANGVLVARFKVPSFIATIGVWSVAYGVTLHASDGGFPIAFLPDGLTRIGNGFVYYFNPHSRLSSFFTMPAGTLGSEIKDLVRVFPNSLILTVMFVAVLWYILKHTRFGQHTYAIGGSMDAAVRSGINTSKHLILVYVLSAMLAGVAGVVKVFMSGTGDFTPFNANYELFAIAAVIIGGASLMGGKGRVMASVVGVLILQILDNGLNLSGFDPFYRFIATGVILIGAVVIDQLFPDLF
jgi:ribose/xylose/arabinose/galactoside ABC-type transport system permease subunit